jgi:hypothetical protein
MATGAARSAFDGGGDELDAELGVGGVEDGFDHFAALVLFGDDEGGDLATPSN